MIQFSSKRCRNGTSVVNLDFRVRDQSREGPALLMKSHVVLGW